MKIYTINQTGMNEIAEFLREKHVNGVSLAESPSCLNAWAAEAEESLDNGNSAMIEIRSFDAISNTPETFTISDAGIDITEIEA